MAMMRLLLSDSGTSPATMRRARPSTMAVLPTPGSPMSTGLFFVRRREHLHDAADFVVAADDGVDLAFAGLFGEVAAVFFQRLVFALGVLVGDALVAAHLLERLHEAVAGDLVVLEQPRGRVVRAGEREQIMLGAEELVLEARSSRGWRRRASGAGRLESVSWPLPLTIFGRRVSSASRRSPSLGVETPTFSSSGRVDAVGLVEKGAQQVFVGQLGMPALGGVVLGGLEGLLGEGGKFIGLHEKVY